jgi:uncharacterized protein
VILPTPIAALGLLAAGVATGLLGGMLGTGGGFFLIPVLVLGFGMPMHYAVATSIVSVIATSSAAASTHVERGTANMRLGMVLEVATATGAIAGGIGAGWISARGLEGLFAAVLVPTAALMWRGRASERSSVPDVDLPDEAPGRLGGHYVEAGGRSVRYRVRRVWAGLAVSFVAGNLSGLLGIGGGVFKVPALRVACGVPMRAAAATSNFMIGVTAAASAFLYLGRGEVQPAVAAAVVLGTVAGSLLGAGLSPRIHPRAIEKLFAVLLWIVAAQMAARAIHLETW